MSYDGAIKAEASKFLRQLYGAQLPEEEVKKVFGAWNEARGAPVDVESFLLEFKSRAVRKPESVRNFSITKGYKVNTHPPTFIFLIKLANQEELRELKMKPVRLVSLCAFKEDFLTQLSQIPILGRDWEEYLNISLNNVEIIEAPEEASDDSFWLAAIQDYVKKFLTEDDKAILNGKHCALDREGLILLRGPSLHAYLRNCQGNKYITRSEIWEILRNLGAFSKVIRSEEATARVWAIPKDRLTQTDL